MWSFTNQKGGADSQWNGLFFVESSLEGMEKEIEQDSTGLRKKVCVMGVYTNTLVKLGTS